MSDDIPASFGQWLKILRKKQGRTQAYVAYKAGVKPITLRKYEQDRLRPSVGTAGLLADALDMSGELRDEFIRRAREPLYTNHPKPAMPPETTSFTGRAVELQRLSQTLRLPDCRILTLAGAGGTGKTRLAKKAAEQNKRHFPGGIYFVPLSGVSSAEAILPAIAYAIEFNFHPGSDPAAALISYLNDKPPMLLVLDNFEHLLPGAVLLHDLLTGTGGLKLLVTSREVLRLPEEWLLELDGLDYPAKELTPAAANCDAVRLFVERARQLKPDFAPDTTELTHIVALCRLVKGNPLALELAVSWIRSLNTEVIVREVRKTLDFLQAGPGRETRHHSIRAVFEQTWERLTPEEQQVYRRLTVFWGTFSLEAAEKICGASLPVMVSLLDKFLIISPQSGCYELHELLSQYTLEKLEAAGEKTTLLEQHCRYYLALVDNLYDSLLGSEQQRIMALILEDLDNVQEAWVYAVDHQMLDYLTGAMRTLIWFHTMKSLFMEGERLMDYAVKHLIPQPDNPLFNKILGLAQVIQSWYAFNMGQFPKALRLCREGRRLVQAVTHSHSLDYWIVLIISAYIEQECGDLEIALQDGRLMLEAGIRLNTPFMLSRSYYGMARTLYGAGKFENALDHFHEALHECEVAHLDWGIAHIRVELGVLLFRLKRYDEAIESFSISLRLFRKLEEPFGIAMASLYITMSLRDAGKSVEVWQYLCEALHYARDIQALPIMSSVLVEVGFHKLQTDSILAKNLLLLARYHPAAWEQTRLRAEDCLKALGFDDETLIETPPELMDAVRQILEDDLCGAN